MRVCIAFITYRRKNGPTQRYRLGYLVASATAVLSSRNRMAPSHIGDITEVGLLMVSAGCAAAQRRQAVAAKDDRRRKWAPRYRNLFVDIWRTT